MSEAASGCGRTSTRPAPPATGKEAVAPRATRSRARRAIAAVIAGQDGRVVFDPRLLAAFGADYRRRATCSARLVDATADQNPPSEVLGPYAPAAAAARGVRSPERWHVAFLTRQASTSTSAPRLQAATGGGFRRCSQRVTPAAQEAIHPPSRSSERRRRVLPATLNQPSRRGSTVASRDRRETGTRH